MKNKKIDFRTSAYFPEGVRFVAVILTLAGLVFIFANLVAGMILLLSGVVILTTSYRMEIDFEKKIFRDYVWLLGIKSGKAERFETIEYIFIKKSKASRNLNSLISTRTITKDTFDGYLKFSEEEKIHLLTKENKTALVARLKPIADALHLKIVDYTAGDPVVIN